MTRFVFVHGVSGPRSLEPADFSFQAYDSARANRDDLFTRIMFGGAASIENPVWSIYAAHPAWNLACVPHAVLKREAGVAALGVGIGALAGIGGSAADPAAPKAALTDMARSDLDALVGSLSTVALEDDPGEETVAFWTAIARGLEEEENRAMLLAVTSDAQLLDRLQFIARKEQNALALNIGESLRNLGGRLTGRFTDLVNSPVVLGIRNGLTPQIAIFIGDVFVYLHEAGPREQIRNAVLDGLLKAARSVAEGEKLILCGHSMGGVILYDLLSDRDVITHLSEALGRPFRADLLLTVGSQVAFFEEMKLYSFRDTGYSAASGKRTPPPVGAARWWNVYNRLDVLSFLAGPVFDGVQDFEASTTAGVTDAHGAYFTNMLFYTRLRSRLKDEGLLA